MKTLMLALGATLAVCGCSRDQSPTSPSTTTAATPTTILFSERSLPHATRFYWYRCYRRPVSAMLASLERNGSPTSNALEIGLGIPAGTGCSVSAALNSSSQLIPQLRQDFGTGTYCVRISDIDGLPASMTFTIRVIHP